MPGNGCAEFKPRKPTRKHGHSGRRVVLSCGHTLSIPVSLCVLVFPVMPPKQALTGTGYFSGATLSRDRLFLLINWPKNMTQEF